MPLRYLRVLDDSKSLHFAIKPKSVTLAFGLEVSGACFGELTVHDFWFVGSPSCDLPLKIHILR
jgi:hypothetical protein